MHSSVEINGCEVGRGRPTFIIAEIGINHNGDLGIAKELIDAAKVAGCDAVKFQKRTPEACVPVEQRSVIRETPWGLMTYLEYRKKVEFGEAEYRELDRYCKERRLAWFASCWDKESVDFIEQFEPCCYKIASACLTDHELIEHTAGKNRPTILSTGMSTMEEIEHAVRLLPSEKSLIAHSTSTYPCSPAELNLRMIPMLEQRFARPVGYSGHEVGLQTTVAATVMGAVFVERHITLNRTMWGSDQAASIEPHGLMRLVRDIRVVEAALGDGVKRVYNSELSSLKRLRRTTSAPC